MNIKDLFSKDLFRTIIGVVKADQQEDQVVWQELEEYVVTRELDKYFRGFFEAYLSVKDNPRDPAISGRMGVWVSGFFGSGKSHFIKILSYLLGNRTVRNPDSNEERKAVDFFDSKVNDHMLLADIKRAVTGTTDVILFNIDSKADSKDGRDAILQVFMKVFNEHLGYCGEHPHIAGMERHLEEKGVLGNFKDKFKTASGGEWSAERDAYSFHKDAVVEALSSALEMSQKAAGDWFDKAEDSYSLTIEKLAAEIKGYLDSKDNDYRIIFLADEVGQFIGSDTHLMLNLQTITEDLGRICQGRAWVIVTSQEDIDAVLGDVRAGKAHDFSKIQGRFNTRLSLSSANTDEVIQFRLLEKNSSAKIALEDLWESKGEILKNQLSFSGGATLKNFRDKEEFVNTYPFAPYHFQLVQKIFESIRKAGATGLHLSRGERSMLEAFQSAAKNISDESIGALVPLYQFYPSIESFLDTAVKKAIDQAKDNPGLEPFDICLLQTLFLIRYVDIIKSSVDNLVTLLIDQVDADRISLKQSIEESLQRLEKETLINRTGDLYFFLTNEERDVSREIKGVDIASGEETKLLSEIIFEDVLKGDNKYRYPVNKRDYGYARFCDGQAYGRAEQDLTIDIITPLNDEFSDYNSAKCIMQSSTDGGRILIKLPDSTMLDREIRAWLQTDKYIRLRNDASAPDTLKRILSDRQTENRGRRGRLESLLEGLIVEADYYVAGQTLEQKASSSRMALADAAKYLVENIYTKLNYLDILHEDPQKEIRSVLTSDDIGQSSMKLDGTEKNTQAVKEIVQFIELSISQNRRIVFSELITKFEGRPYGWPEWEIVLILAQLFMAGEIKVVLEGGAIQPREAVDPFTKSVKWKQLSIQKRKTPGKEELEKSRKLSQTLFGEIGPESVDGLSTFIKGHLVKWQGDLSQYKPLADTGSYPGKREIDNALGKINALEAIHDTYEFYQTFIHEEETLKQVSADIHELADFYNHQKPAWERLTKVMNESFRPNRHALSKDAKAADAIERIDEILAAGKPYAMLKEADSLISKISSANDELLIAKRGQVVLDIEVRIEQVRKELDGVKAGDDLRNQCLKPLQDLKKAVVEEKTLPGIAYHTNQSGEALEAAIALIEASDKDTGKSTKPIEYVSAAKHSPKAYLENEEDIDDFLNNLKKELLGILKKNSRVRIK